MEMILTGIENKNEYYTNHYFTSIFQDNAEDTIKKWKEREKAEEIQLPWKKLRDVRTQYYNIRDKYLRWVKLSWNEQNVLADSNPRLAVKKVSAAEVALIRGKELERKETFNTYLEEYVSISSMQNFLDAKQNYEELGGQQTNLYKCFIPQSFYIGNTKAVIGLLHPDSVYDDPNGDLLRRAIYRRLRSHFQFMNIMQEPLEKWRIFLHPTQRKVVGKKFNGPARVLGGAGTGKTVVAMHRAKMLASSLNSDGKILFTTYTKNLAEDIKDNLRKICSAEEMKRIDIINLDAWVSNFLRRQGYEYQIVYDEEVDKAWRDAIAIAAGELSFVENFYKDEWVKVVQAQEVYDKVAYCKAPRIGRGVRLDRKVRMQIWDVFDEYQNIMNEKLQRDVETAMYECRKILENKKLTGQYTSIIVDEGQDLSPSAYRLLRALAGEEHENDIFIVGDSHQRIYRNKAVLSKCGINVRGRSSYLRINYRTTEEIRKFAFGLLNGVSFDDLDEDYDNGKGCQSLTHGDKPEIKEFATPEEELDFLVTKIKDMEASGIEQKNICIVARTHKLLDNYIAGLQRAGIKSFEIKANKIDDRSFDGVRIATMHRVKGLEFDHVFAVAVNKKVLPFGTRADFEDDISLEEFRTGEKCLLYVALTRARKSACVTCYGGLSELIV